MRALTLGLLVLASGCLDIQSHIERSGSFNVESPRYDPQFLLQSWSTLAGQRVAGIGDERVYQVTVRDLLDPGASFAYGVWLDPSGAPGLRLVGNLTKSGPEWAWQGKFPTQSSFDRVVIMLEALSERGSGVTLGRVALTGSGQSAAFSGSEYPQSRSTVSYTMKGRNWSVTWRDNFHQGNSLTPPSTSFDACLWIRSLGNGSVPWNRTECRPLKAGLQRGWSGTGRSMDLEFQYTLEPRNATGEPSVFLLGYAWLRDGDSRCGSLRCRAPS